MLIESIDQLKYGNISLDDQSYLYADNIFTHQFEKFINKPYPDKHIIFDEINDLIKKQEKILNKENSKTIKDQVKAIDYDMFEVFKEYILSLGIDFKKDYLAKVGFKLNALIVQLKNHYNRARPNQVSYYMNLPLHPMDTFIGNCPSYPSRQTLVAHFLCKIVSHHNPDKKDDIMDFSAYVSNSREIMGLNYPSDNLFAVQIAEFLSEIKEIRQIYFKPIEKNKEVKSDDTNKDTE